MATLSLPSKAYGAPSKRGQKSPGVFASIRNYFRAREDAEIDDYVKTHFPAERWTDAADRELSDALLFGRFRR